jgi:hypothetical protein
MVKDPSRVWRVKDEGSTLGALRELGSGGGTGYEDGAVPSMGPFDLLRPDPCPAEVGLRALGVKDKEGDLLESAIKEDATEDAVRGLFPSFFKPGRNELPAPLARGGPSLPLGIPGPIFI